MSQIVSVQVGLPKWYDVPEGDRAAGKRWNTAFYKEPVHGAVEVLETHLAGDGSSDRKHHGGLDKAVLAYPWKHYAFWRPVLGEQMSPGAFGENLTIADQEEGDVCIGDRWRVGNVELEITQPRQPCFKLARRWRRPQIVKEVISEGKTGWYYRVIRTGSLEAGQSLELVSRTHPEWSIERCNRVYYARPLSEEREVLAALPELSFSWKEELLSS